MNLETLSEIERVSKSLLYLRRELERYYKEEHLNKTKDLTPWISVKISNHPTYLKDFTVSMSDDNLRDSIVKLAIQQIKMSIKELEKELTEELKDFQKKD